MRRLFSLILCDHLQPISTPERDLETKAIQILQTGAEVMGLREIPTPRPGKGEVLVPVEASGVNFIDVYVREGRYSNQTPFTSDRKLLGLLRRWAKEWQGGSRCLVQHLGYLQH